MRFGSEAQGVCVEARYLLSLLAEGHQLCRGRRQRRGVVRGGLGGGAGDGRAFLLEAPAGVKEVN